MKRKLDTAPSFCDLRSSEVKIKLRFDPPSWHGHQRRVPYYCDHDYVVKRNLYLSCRKHFAAVNARLSVSLPLRGPFEREQIVPQTRQKMNREQPPTDLTLLLAIENRERVDRAEAARLIQMKGIRVCRRHRQCAKGWGSAQACKIAICAMWAKVTPCNTAIDFFQLSLTTKV